VESGTSSNVTHEGLLDVLRQYEAFFAEELSVRSVMKDAHAAARDRMRELHHCDRKLGIPKFKADLWLQCGVLEDETEVPEAERRHYCGLWFHACCVGVLRAPKSAAERVQCLSCLQDRRYRVKVPAAERVAELSIWSARGVPRIAESDSEERIKTFHLSCNCGMAPGMGLPCEGMLAVARACGAVISFHSYHSHGFSTKLIQLEAATPVFRRNLKLRLNVDAVVEHEGDEEPPATMSDVPQPEVAVVIQSKSTTPGVLILSMNGKAVDGTSLDEIVIGDAKSTRRKHRRHKSKPGRTGKLNTANLQEKK
jgi:hypothetical protein